MSLWNDLTVTPTQTVRVGEGGAVETNTDPDAFDNVWVARTSGTSAILYGVAWNGTRVVAVGAGGVVRVSDDEGLTWYAATSGVSTDLYAIDVGDNVFIAVGALGVILTSQAGLSWEPVDSGTAFDLWDVTVLNAEYTAVGDNDVIVVGTLVSAELHVDVAETLAVAADESTTGTFNVAASDGITVDELVHRQTFAPTPVLIAVTEHMGFEDSGETDVGGAVESGFDETTTNLDVVVNEALLLDDVNQGQYQGDVAEQFFMFLNDEMAVSSVQSTDQIIANASAVDSFTMDDRPFINNETLADTFALATSLTGAYGRLILEDIGLDDAVTAAQAMLETLAETVAVGDVPGVTGTVLLTVSDGFAFDDAASLNQIVNELVSEGIAFGVAVALDGEPYLAWVMNTETFGLTNYENFRFNSMAAFGASHYATDGTAIYRLDGGTDAGAVINAEFSPGATDFGSAFMKRMDRAYLGLRADGQMVLKVVTDEQVEDWYLLEETPAALGSVRVKIGKGLKARYWRVRVANKGGADFDVDSLRLIPLQTSRRVK